MGFFDAFKKQPKNQEPRPVEKKEVEMPDELKGIVKCNNPKCITNNEPMQTWFHVVDKEKGLLKCHYCEKEQQKDNIKLL